MIADFSLSHISRYTFCYLLIEIIRIWKYLDLKRNNRTSEVLKFYTAMEQLSVSNSETNPNVRINPNICVKLYSKADLCIK
jgi:hypothetical protein